MSALAPNMVPHTQVADSGSKTGVCLTKRNIPYIRRVFRLFEAKCRATQFKHGENRLIHGQGLILISMTQITGRPGQRHSSPEIGSNLFTVAIINGIKHDE
jgi:hypothetical protein